MERNRYMPFCRGSILLGTACGYCQKCQEEQQYIEEQAIRKCQVESSAEKAVDEAWERNNKKI